MCNVTFVKINLNSDSNFTACLHIASVIEQKDLKQWLAECNVDMDKVLLC